MTDPNIHIKEFIEYYLKLQHAPGYAVLLKGQWGSGKTWLIKDIFKMENSKKKELYISLYGMSSFEDIEDEIFKQLHPVLSSKTLSVASKIAKGLLKTTLKIDIESGKNTSTIIQSQIPDIDIPNFLKNTEEMVFIFDDLERSSINLNSLLGYINHFVEHQECKVIIIANESEIITTPSKENKKEFEIEYLRIKEKLIGREFSVSPNSNDAIKSFISEIQNKEICTFLKNQTENIININNRSRYNNLRNIRNALFEFERFSNKLEIEYLNSNEFMEKILKIFLILFIEIRSGEITNENFNSVFRHNGIIPLGKEPGDDKIKQIVHHLSEKYTSFNLCIDKDIWSTFLFDGYADKDRLNKSISYTSYFNEENKPNWVKLWGINELTEFEFQETLPLVKDEFYNKKYSEIGEVKHVFGILLGLCEDGLINSTKDDLLEFTKEYLLKIIKKQSIEQLQEFDPYLDNRSWEGLGFHKLDSTEFKEINIFIENEKLKNYQNCKPEIARNLINLITTDPELFSRRIILNNHKDNLYYQDDILSYSDENIFCDKLMLLPPKKRSTIFYALNARYQYDNFNQKLISELPWLEKIINILNERTAEKNITSLQIKILMDHYLLPAKSKLLNSKG